MSAFQHVRVLTATALLALGAAGATSAAESAAPVPPEPPTPGVLAKLAGVWSEVMVTADRCESASRPHTFEVSPDGLRLTQRFSDPVYPDDAQPEVRRYRILYGDERSVVLYLEGETMVDATTGDAPIRQLVLHGADDYRWRLLGKPPEWRAMLGGRRCPTAPATQS